MLRAALWILALTGPYEGDKEFTDRMVPPGWQGNPWGPGANLARKNGQIPPVVMTPTMQQWDKWGRQVLRDGDIVFRRGDARILRGWFPISKFLANCSGSLYSHTAIVAIEDGQVMTYDTTDEGVRCQPFAVWMLDNVGAFGVKRPRPQYRDKVPAVLAWCRKLYREQNVPFDYELGIDDSALYCVEMTEKAYRSAGLTLSQPIRLGDMEHAAEKPLPIIIIQLCSEFQLEHPLSLEQPVFFPGNERHGIWSSPILETVYEPKASTASRPAQTPGDRK